MRHAEDTPTRMPSVDPDRIIRNHERELHGWGRAVGPSPLRRPRAAAAGITPRRVRAWLRQPN
jgi:hypothetical protein